MVSEKKKVEVARMKELIEKYPVVGILDFFKLPSKQLQSMRKSLRNVALIKMSKKRLMERALKGVKGKDGIERLCEFPVKEPALIFTEVDPFKLFKLLKKNRFLRHAKANDTAPKDIVVPAGPTSLPAGPAIGELQRVGIPAMVKEGKIHVREDTLVVKEGETISAQLANVLKKLDIQPIEVGIDLVAAWKDGIVYGKDVLDVDEKAYERMIREAWTYALNLCVNAHLFNEESMKILLWKAYQHGKNLGLKAEILDEGIVEDLINKASIQAHTLKERLKV